MADNPYDGGAVQLVPQNVEKLPLWHWRPGARLLAVGSRDGARFDGRLDPSEARSFRRELSPELLRGAQAQARTDGVFACFSESLRYPRSLGACLSASDGARVVATAGHGEAELVAQLLPRVDAWLLMLGGEPGAQVATIAASGRHVELVLALPVAATLPALAWERIAAVHLQPARSTAAVGDELAAWEDAARALLPADVVAYGHRDRHTSCVCGEILVWRSSGRSRRETLDADGRCTACGRDSGIRIG